MTVAELMDILKYHDPKSAVKVWDFGAGNLVPAKVVHESNFVGPDGPYTLIEPEDIEDENVEEEKSIRDLQDEAEDNGYYMKENINGPSGWRFGPLGR